MAQEGLKKRDIHYTLASTKAGPCEGSNGGHVNAEVAFKDVRYNDFDALAVIGGPGSAELAKDEDVLNVCRAFWDASKPIGAICHGPYILAAAGALKGKQASVWTNGGKDSKLPEYIESRGVKHTGKPVTVDGRIVTAEGPSSAKEFGEAFAGILAA